MSRLSPREMAEALNALSRHQELNATQSRALERAIVRLAAEEGRRKLRRWTPREIDAVKAIIRPDAGPGRPRGDRGDVARVARILSRTPEAVVQCMKRMRADARGTSRKREYQLNLELRAG